MRRGNRTAGETHHRRGDDIQHQRDDTDIEVAWWLGRPREQRRHVVAAAIMIIGPGTSASRPLI